MFAPHKLTLTLLNLPSTQACIRPQPQEGCEGLLFLSPTGAKLTHTAAHMRQLSKAVTRTEIHVTPTMMRKLVATSVVGS